MIFDTLKPMAIGSALTLIAVQLAYTLSANSDDFSNPSLADNTCKQFDANIVEEQSLKDHISIYQDVSKSGISDTFYSPNQQLTHQNPNACQGACLVSLAKKLVSGELDKGLDWDLASDNAQQIAEHLTQYPEQILVLENLFTSITSPGEREVILFVISKLPREKLFESAQRLTLSNTPEDRIAGLSLFEASIGSDVSIAQDLSQLIDIETDDNVLVRAIKIIDQFTATEIDVTTRARLSELIENSLNEKIVAAALFAKISSTTNDEDVRGNINSILQTTSETDNLKLIGLQALDKVLTRQQYKPEQGEWQQDPEFQNHVAALANDVKAPPVLRIEALNLLRRHFP